LLAACGQAPRSDTVSTSRVDEARAFLHNEVTPHNASAPVNFRVFTRGNSPIKTIDVTPTRIKITTQNNIPLEGKQFAFSLKELTPNNVCDDATCLVSIIRDGNVLHSNYVSYEFAIPNTKDAPKKADQLTYALTVLQQAALELRSTNAQFRKTVDSYRSASPKPTLPENANRLKTQAEASAHNHQYNDAVEAYAQALEIAPWWPEGHYNMALNLAEAKDHKNAIDYDAAVDEMQCYLMLEPEGSDAKAAQDKIQEWQGRLVKPKWYQF